MNKQSARSWHWADAAQGFARARQSGTAPVLVCLWLMFGLCSPLAQAQDFEALKAGVVKVSARRDEVASTGTGFVVKVEGDDLYIVTASHVVEGDPQPQVYFHARRGVPVTAKVLKLEGGDARGIALLLVPGGAGAGRDARVLPWSREEALAGGEDLASIGFGQGQGEWAVIRLSVTAIDGRDIRLEGRVEEGNSGGPLLRDGKVVGLITGMRQGFGVASPGYIVAGTLRGWRLDGIGAAEAARPAVSDTPAAKVMPSGASAEEGVVLRGTSIKAGTVTREEGRFDLRDAVLTLNVGGQLMQGSARIERSQSLEREVLAVTQGRASKVRLRFRAMPGSFMREIGGDRDVEDRTSPLQGLTVVATRVGDDWNYVASAGALSAQQLRELPAFVVTDDEGFPAGAVTPGQQWEVSGPALHQLLQLGDLALTGGKAVMRLQGVQPCGAARCARVDIQLRVSGVMTSDDGAQTTAELEGAGQLLREIGSAITREGHLDGRMTLTGSFAGTNLPVELRISGPIIVNSTVRD